MKKYNEKTFHLEAKTGKGNFKVELTVWQELASGQSFKNVLFWESEMYVYVDGIKMKCSDYDKNQPSLIHSREACEYFQVPLNAKMKCDSTEVRKYINNIQDSRRKEIAEEIYEVEQDLKTIKRLHDA